MSHSQTATVQGLDFETGAATHVGLARTENEDSFLAAPAQALWAVADGMGGLDDGKLASQTLVETLDTLVPTRDSAAAHHALQTLVARANERIREIAAERGNRMMGTTLVAVLAAGGEYVCAWAGDSRVYRLRDGTLAQITRDHSEVQELLDQGVITAEQASKWPRRNAITRAVGVTEDVRLETRSEALHPGDTFLLCSDGLTRHVADQEIAEALATRDPQAACDALIATTLERGAGDNVTIVIARAKLAGG